MNKKDSGVISLEACIVVPIFIFLILFVYGFIVMFMGQQVIENALLQSTASLSLDSYATEKFHNGNTTSNDSIKEKVIDFYEQLVSQGTISGLDSDTNFSTSKRWYINAADTDTDDEKASKELDRNTVIRNRFLGFLTGEEEDSDKTVDSANSILKMVGVKDGIDGIDFSECKVENGTLTMKIKYKQEFVFDFNGLAAFDREMTATAKMWGI